MKTWVADCETDGLLDRLTKMHSFCAHVLEDDYRISASKEECDQAIEELQTADKAVFHNGIRFDFKAIKKIYPGFTFPISKIIDTLVLSRLLCPHIHEIDEKVDGLPKKLKGSHGLEAWGYRLGKHKGDYAKEMGAAGLDPWAEWNPSMQTYCNTDVDVTIALYNMMLEAGIPERASELEHWFAVIIDKMQDQGFCFDIEAADRLYQDILTQVEEIDAKLEIYVKPWYAKDKEFTPKVSRGDYTKGCELTKIKLKEFKPTSRDHIADRLIKCYGWVPKVFTPTGKPKVDEETLETVDHEIGELLAHRFILSKRLGQIKDGAKGWLNLHKQGRLHGYVNTLGAVTGRCTHSDPNMAQIPSCGALYGKECRALFGVPKGYKQVGCDASGLELRCLAHFMAEYDNGEYVRVLLEGDIHTVNQEAAGLPTRDNAKTFIYGFLYGAGDAKIGSIVNGTKEDGKRLKNQFLEKLPALKKLRDTVTQEAREKGFIYGIDGRKLYVRHEHAVLNTLLQSAGALLVKQATINLFKRLTKEGFVWGKDWSIVAHVHDEYQLEVKEVHANYIAEVSEWSFQQAGRDFEWRCPLDGEAKIGNNWSETH